MYKFGKLYSICVFCYGISIYISHSNCTNLFDSSGISFFLSEQGNGRKKAEEKVQTCTERCYFMMFFEFSSPIRKICALPFSSFSRPISSSIQFACMKRTHTLTHTICIQYLHSHRLRQITTLLFTSVCLALAGAVFIHLTLLGTLSLSHSTLCLLRLQRM